MTLAMLLIHRFTTYTECMKESDWRERAACKDTYPEIFFPEKGESYKEARRFCRVCEVAEFCLRDAMDTNEKYGMRGGLTPSARRKLKVKQMRLARDADSEYSA